MAAYCMGVSGTLLTAKSQARTMKAWMPAHRPLTSALQNVDQMDIRTPLDTLIAHDEEPMPSAPGGHATLTSSVQVPTDSGA